MHRIDTPGNVAGRFSIGSPQTGQKPTRLGQDWPNAVQEELAHLCEYAGLVLNKLDATQVRQAVVALIAGIVGTGGGSVPTTRQFTGQGMMAGQGGNFAVDRTFGIFEASPADVLAGLRADVVLTPSNFAQAFGGSLAANDVYRAPGGLIIQFIRAFVSANGVTNVTLPLTFPNASLGAFVNGGYAGGGSRNNTYIGGDGLSTVSVINHEFFALNVNIVAFGK